MKSLPVCLGISLIKLMLGKLRFSKQYVGEMVKMQDGQSENPHHDYLVSPEWNYSFTKASAQ